jgi:PucR C-terminal helix-turn-helix domain
MRICRIPKGVLRAHGDRDGVYRDHVKQFTCSPGKFVAGAHKVNPRRPGQVHRVRGVQFLRVEGGNPFSGMSAASTVEQVSLIGAELSRRAEQLGAAVAAAVRGDIGFYRHGQVVSHDQRVESCTANVRFICDGLAEPRSFDTTPAAVTGESRAQSRVPLPVVMAAYRVGSHLMWQALLEVVEAHSEISRHTLLTVTERIWEAQDVYTEAMTTAYRRRATRQAIDDEAERAALTKPCSPAPYWPVTVRGRSRTCWGFRRRGLMSSSLRVPPSWASMRCQASTTSCAALTFIRRGDCYPSSKSALSDVNLRLANAVLGDLDRVADGERDLLYQTFREWLAHRGSVPEAAAALFCHPNTVRHLPLDGS